MDFQSAGPVLCASLGREILLRHGADVGCKRNFDVENFLSQKISHKSGFWPEYCSNSKINLFTALRRCTAFSFFENKSSTSTWEREKKATSVPEIKAELISKIMSVKQFIDNS